MTNIVSPSKTTVGITDGQIEKASDLLRVAMRKHRSEFNDTEVAQQAVTAKEFATDLLAVFRKHFERFSNLIVRIVRPDRNRTPKAVLDATGRKQYVTNSVVAEMPRSVGDEVRVVFFKPDRSAYNKNGWISDENLEKQYELYGLKPVDPFSLAAVNEADPVFADNHPNATHWKNTNGEWCYAAFNRWNDGRRVRVDRLGSGWDDYWWFAGLAS